MPRREGGKARVAGLTEPVLWTEWGYRPEAVPVGCGLATAVSADVRPDGTTRILRTTFFRTSRPAAGGFFIHYSLKHILIMGETAKELHRNAPAEPTQTAVPAHHRFYHTRLWQLIRGEITVINAESRGAEDGTQTAQPAADGPAREELQIILNEFLDILTDYCRNEPSLKERFLTLRVTRSGLITDMLMRTPPGAEKKCGHLDARRTGARCFRRRIGGYPRGFGREVRHVV